VSHSKNARKQAVADYKSLKPRQGVFAVRCAPTGHAWVGASRNLDATRNGIWFVLRIGSHRDAALQADWQAHGEEAFRFDVLEELDADVSPLLVTNLLKAKMREHALREHAPTLLP
jgi:hypothetical protein